MTDDHFCPPPAGGEAQEHLRRRAQVWDLLNAYGPDVAALRSASRILLPGMAGASLSAGRAPAGPTVRFTTDEVSSRIEELQHAMEEGPCRDAAGSRRPVAAADLTTGPWRERWPRFTPAALDAGVRAVFALPLHAGGVRHEGAVDLYRRTPGGWDDSERTVAKAFAAAAAELITLEEHNLDWATTLTRGRSGGSDAPGADASVTAAPASAAPGKSTVLLACWFDVTAVPEVRSRLREVSSREGLTGDHLYQFVLAVHEAMTNVVRHGGGHGQLLLWWRADHLWCEITDHGSGIPDGNLRARQPSAGKPNHHGLWLIRRTCTSCKVTTDRTGTRLLLGYRLDRR